MGLALVYPYYLNMFWLIPDGAEILRGHLPTSVAYALSSTHLVAQEWLYEACIAWAVQHGAYGAFALACAVAAAATPPLAYAAIRTFGIGDVSAGLASLLVVGARFVCVAVRPETFAVDAFALCILVLAGRASRLWILPLVALWANVHASAMLAPLAAVVFAAGEAIAHGIGDRAGRAMTIAALATLATLLTPSGLGLWSYAIALTVGGNPVRTHLGVWAPLSFADQGTWATVVPGLVILLALGVALRRAHAPEVALALLGLTLAAMHQRYETFLAIAWSPAIARSLERIAVVLRFEARRPSASLGIAIALLPVIGYAAVRVPATLRAPAVPSGPWQDAAILARTGRLHGNAYVEYTWGAYLLWQRLPLRLLIDSHGDPFSKDVWDDHLALQNLRPNWREVLARRRIAVVILPSDAPLLAALALDPAWRTAGARGDVRAFTLRSRE